jgi:hypothetical protein
MYWSDVILGGSFDPLALVEDDRLGWMTFSKAVVDNLTPR